MKNGLLVDDRTLKRSEAKTKGLKYYFAGKACKRGHVSERYVSCGTCVECVTARALAWYATNPERAQATGLAYYTSNMKQCNVKSRSWRKANPERMQTLIRAWRVTNRVRYNTQMRAWAKANPEKKRAFCRAHRAANRELYNERSRTWQAANPARRRALREQWNKANPAKCTMYSRARKARKLRAMPAWACKQSIERIYAESRRLTHTTGIEHHVDHVVPLKSPIVCGLHVEHNLQVLRAVENRKKSNSLLEAT